MKCEEVASILGRRLDKTTLSHLYLIRFNSERIQFENIVKVFVSQFGKTNSPTHPDILTVEIDEDEKIYKVESKNIEYFTKFLNFRPTNLKHKFVFIKDAHLISDTLSNKLLKTFEELNDYSSIFLFVENQYEILPTIKSRAIEIHLSADKAKVSTPEFNIAHNSIMNLIKKEKITELNALNQIIDYRINNSSNFLELSQLLEDIKTFDIHSVFNHSKSTKLASILP